MKKLLTCFLALLIITSCNKAQDCKKLPQHFTSYKEAISQVKNSTFKFTDEANTSRSSWLTSAKYYSCDGITGFFIYATNRNYEYIHKDVPINVWKQFKSASSLGSFYDAHIKNRYRLELN
jgi:hypothetical protein